jgi:hypothetical protein
MRALGFAYRFVTNFAFLATVYLSLNYIENYNNRAVLAIAILIYAGMRAAIALRSFYFFQTIERLVTVLRRDGEVKSYIDLFFLAAVVLLCVTKIVASN